MGLHSSATLVGPGAGRLRGFARTVLGISTVELEITSPAGLISTLVCADLDRASGEWSCSWDATAANGGVPPADGEFFSVRLRATDVNGNTSPWSAAHTIRVDAQPPAIALSTEAMGIDPGRAVRGSRLRLIGSALDNDKVARVTVCLDQESCRTADLSHPGAGSSDWSKWVTLDGAMDYVTKTLTIRAMDRLGNSTTEPLTMPVVFDNVPPVLAADQILTQVPLSSTQTVLTGNVGDGSPRVEVSVRMQPPRGTLTRLPAARDGGTWWFDLPADLPGQYTLWADAEDLAGNVTTAGPFTVDVTCTNAAPVLTSLTAEPVAGWPLSLTLTVVISNAGPELLPAGFPIVVSEGISETSRLTTTVPLGPGESEALSLVWTPDGATDHAIEVTAGRDEVLPGGPLCVGPRTARFTVPVGVDMLYLGWNLISPPVNPTNPSVDVVQHGVDGDYRAIVGYDGGLLSYDPDRPGDSTLTTIDALHGYWIDATVDPSLPPTDTHAFVPVASWRMTGERLPEDRPLSLAPGWNLVGYLPQRPLTVTTALEGITGQYGAVLGFERTALSYYPDLDSSYNTLYDMAPGFGYWISATQALTFAYPTTTITHTLPTTATMMVQEKLRSVRLAEGQAGVQPTYEWANFYGPLSLPEATPVPTGTVVLAVDPQGVICGATMVWEPGQYGLLACYRDDPATAADEGALPGDVIQLFVSSDGTQPDGQFVGAGLWTGHGHRWQVEEGVLPLTNLTISKELVPQAALPGATITYTLAYTNTSNLVAQGVVILDLPPLEIEFTGYSSWGAPVTLTVGSDTFSWQVADLGPGEGGIITVTSIVSPALTSALVLTNTAIITAPLEGWPGDNVAEAVLQVNAAPQYPWQIWLPLIERGQQ
jgi:uncharacterized repeat protein (TIGR01451 family)